MTAPSRRREREQLHGSPSDARRYAFILAHVLVAPTREVNAVLRVREVVLRADEHDLPGAGRVRGELRARNGARLGPTHQLRPARDLRLEHRHRLGLPGELADVSLVVGLPREEIGRVPRALLGVIRLAVHVGDGAHHVRLAELLRDVAPRRDLRHAVGVRLRPLLELRVGLGARRVDAHQEVVGLTVRARELGDEVRERGRHRLDDGLRPGDVVALDERLEALEALAARHHARVEHQVRERLRQAERGSSRDADPEALSRHEHVIDVTADERARRRRDGGPPRRGLRAAGLAGRDAGRLDRRRRGELGRRGRPAVRPRASGEEAARDQHGGDQSRRRHW